MNKLLLSLIVSLALVGCADSAKAQVVSSPAKKAPVASALAKPQFKPVTEPELLWSSSAEPSAEVTSIAYSPDGKTLASGSYDKTIKLWDARSGALLRTLEGHTSWVDAVIFAPDGDTLASGSFDQTIKLWRVPAR